MDADRLLDLLGDAAPGLRRALDALDAYDLRRLREEIAQAIACRQCGPLESEVADLRASRADLARQVDELRAGFPPTAADDAVQYLLNRVQTDPDLAYHISPLTESFDRLCSAEAVRTGEAPEVVRARRSQDLQPAHRKRRAAQEVLKEEVEHLTSCNDCEPGDPCAEYERIRGER